MPPKKTKTEADDEPADDHSEEFKSLRKMITEVKSMIRGVSASQKECQKSQEHISEEYDGLKASQGEILAQLKSMQQKVDKLTSACQSKDKEINMLKSRVLMLENHSRRRNIEIQGVTESPGEDVQKIVCKVVSAIGVDLRESEIECAHRVPTKVENRPKPIIVELASRKKRDEIVAVRGYSVFNKEVTGSNAPGKIYVYAQISPDLKNLRWKAKEKAKEKNWKFVWIKDGNLLAKKSELTSNVIKIVSESDLAKIC